MKFFLAVYTNVVKDYVDTEFFSNLYKLSRGNPVVIVDNTLNGTYTDRIETLTHAYPNFHVNWIMVPREPRVSQFQRNVTESVNFLRDEFLKSDCDHMLIVESDVLPPIDVLDRLEESVTHLDQFAGSEWAIIGGLYYAGFHSYELTGLHQTHHCLSGCTLYNRSFLRDNPFRWNESNIGAFPDAWSSIDAQDKGFTIWNNHNIHCEHIEISRGNRGHSKL